MQNICHFCDEEIVEFSKDHIFPDSFGGTTSVACCRGCNNLYGHKFEYFIAEEIKSTQGMIMSWGLEFKRNIPNWENVFKKEGKSYSMRPAENGRLTPELTKPVYEKDENGDLKSATFQTEAEAIKFKQQLEKKGVYKIGEIVQQKPVEIEKGDLGVTLVVGNQLKRIALKMCLNLLVHFDAFKADKLKIAKFYLYKEYLDLSVAAVFPSYLTYPDLDAMRPGLAHLIYVEKNRYKSYGIVQLFGVVQIYCNLGDSVEKNDETAYLGTLDIFTGEEFFSIVPKMNLKTPPESIRKDEYSFLFQGWLNKYQVEAIRCNATHPPDLRIESLKIDE